MFGFPGPSKLKIMRFRRAGSLVLGMMKRIEDRQAKRAASEASEDGSEGCARAGPVQAKRAASAASEDGSEGCARAGPVEGKRIGFVIMFPPTADFDFWEFGYAILDPNDRDAFSALCATDAMAHYMFDHLRVEAMGWRTRADNRAADAVVRRLGYRPFGAWTVDGHHYTFYRLDRDGWTKRFQKLQAGERTHPSGIGDVFVTLADPPWEPVLPGE